MLGRRLIEETFPVKEVSVESAQEKNIRHGHISALHIWWARRPLASSRATAYAALTPVALNLEELKRKKQFIVKLSKWDSGSDYELLETARKDILTANNDVPPRVLDPFAGGGAIPLEALRLGCETYASDYNPVSVLILKCTLEYPRKFGGNSGRTRNGLDSAEGRNRLVEDVREWSNWVLQKVKSDLGRFYVDDEDGAVPVGYAWARSIPCPNPSCNAEVPLIRQFWLARKKNKKVALFPSIVGKKVNFKIVGTGYESFPKGFDPSRGSISRAVATCFICGSAIDADTIKAVFAGKRSNERMIAVVKFRKGIVGKSYRTATDADLRLFKKAEECLVEKRRLLTARWGIDPVPDEPTPEGKGRGAERAFSVRNYNMNTWGDLFNSRQKLVLISFGEQLRAAHKEMLDRGMDLEYSKAVVSYLSLIVSRCADFESTIVRWFNHVENTCNTFARQALPMTWDYFELNPFSQVSQGTYRSMSNQVLKALEFLVGVEYPATCLVRQQSATSLGYADNYFDAVFTDPPYYDNVPYSYLSDFFYVWLKRSMSDTYPDLFATPLSPKREEIVVYSNSDGGFEGGKKFFEDMLKKSFAEIRRVLKPNGVSVIVYAHKSTAGWETLINSLLASGLVVTGAWPIHTEMTGRLRASESAALASSIYMVARKSKKLPTGFYLEVKDELKKYLNEKLDRLWNEGISGADFLISGIGSSIEIFGKYETVIDDEGNTIGADRLLEDVRRIVTDYAVKQVLHNGFAEEISPMTRFYVLWRWAFGEANIDFDDARKLAQSVGIDMPQSWNKGFIKKDKEFIQVLGPDERALGDLEGSRELIDVLHEVLLLWKKGLPEEITRVLTDSGFGKSEAFYRVAQAVSESLPAGSGEKKLLEGFVAGTERLKSDLREESSQTRLFE